MYNNFAFVYDEFMENVPYDKWGDMVCNILKKEETCDGLILDLGCGTGKLTRIMQDRGYDMIGIDLSEEMLSVAREYQMDELCLEPCDYPDEEEPEDSEETEGLEEPKESKESEDSEDLEKPEEPEKSEETEGLEEPKESKEPEAGYRKAEGYASDLPAAKPPILYLCQDMRSFELYGTVRAIYSLCDCINYIRDYNDLIKVLKLANNYLDPGGLFIFDINTIYKFENVLGDNTYAENREDASFIWENYYDDVTKENHYYLTLYLLNEDGTYDRDEEEHIEKGYTVEEILKAIEASGMDFVEMFDEETGKPVSDYTERILFIARERGKIKKD